MHWRNGTGCAWHVALEGWYSSTESHSGSAFCEAVGNSSLEPVFGATPPWAGEWRRQQPQKPTSGTGGRLRAAILLFPMPFTVADIATIISAQQNLPSIYDCAVINQTGKRSALESTLCDYLALLCPSSNPLQSVTIGVEKDWDPRCWAAIHKLSVSHSHKWMIYVCCKKRDFSFLDLYITDHTMSLHVKRGA